LSLIEAAACGRAIVTTDTPGCRDLVRDGVEGLLVPPGDVQALAAALRRLATDVALRQRLGAAARARAVSEFTHERAAAAAAQAWARALA
jgi:glycosyltransferase involved in cell wall biosynthesis